MKAKAIIFDLDGTAIDSPTSKLPTANLVAQIERLKNNYYLCAATGRVWPFAKSVLKTLNLTDPCIISAGSQICNPQTGEIIWQKNVDPESLSQVLEVLKNYPEYKVLANEYTENDYFNGGVSPSNFHINTDIYFFEQVFVPEQIATKIVSQLNVISNIAVVLVTAQKPGCNDIHILNQDATKEQAVAQLLKILNVAKKDTIGIGDGHNDIHLFNAVNFKVAMGNAVDILKEAADEIIGTVDQDGLAKYLTRV